MVNLASFWKTEACGQTVLPDRSVLIRQKLVENAKIQRSEIIFEGRKRRRKAKNFIRMYVRSKRIIKSRGKAFPTSNMYLPELTLRNVSGLSVVWLQVGNLSTNVPFRGGGKGDMTLTDSSSFSPSSWSTFKNGATVIRLARAIFFTQFVLGFTQFPWATVCSKLTCRDTGPAPETHWKFINGFRTEERGGGDKYFLMRIFIK